jgi:hypothetical protein
VYEKDERGNSVQCIVITRNGCGVVLRFSDLKAARLHPVPQMDDVFASTPDQLVEQFGKGLIEDLLRFAEGRTRARLVDAFEVWKQGGSLLPDAKQLLWETVLSAGVVPPADATEIVRIIKEDRLFREGRVLRSISTEGRSSASFVRPESRRKTEMNDTVARKRVDENSTITVATEERKNPKRAGSSAFDRFELYQDGMTVKEAKAAGVTATDISYDAAHGFITLTPGEATEEAETNGEEESPKRGRKSSKAA